MPGAKGRDWLRRIARHHSRTPPGICHSLGPSKKLNLEEAWTEKVSCCWDFLRASWKPIYLRPKISLALSLLFSIHLCRINTSRHFSLIQLYHPVRSYHPYSYHHPSERIKWASASKAFATSYIHPVSTLLFRLGAGCGNTLPCARVASSQTVGRH